MKANLPNTDLPRVVVIGGGYGGITVAQALRKAPVQVVMIDKNNYHTFQPLLYQVASGGLEPDSIAFPLRKMFAKQKNFTFRWAEVDRVHPDKKCIETSIGTINYDYLVIATGSKTNFFGNKEIETNALGMKSIPESLDLRSLILQNFEEAHDHQSTEVQDRLMGFVVVGGGPTGVETAGALAELKAHVLPSDYPDLDLDLMDIHLIEAGGRILKGMSENSSQDALRSLEKLGVSVHLNTLVTSFDGSVVETKSGEKIDASTVIWAAGVQGAAIDGLEEAIEQRPNRLKVDKYNRVEGYEDVFAVGDIALMQTEEYERGHPMVAPVAMQMGEHLGKNLAQMFKGAPLKPFRYFDKGSMATIGRNKAVLDLGKLHLRGIVAWLGWMFVHIFYLIGFRNKVVVFVNWVWSYFTYDKGTRLIIRPYKRKDKNSKEKVAAG
ncbi:MAG: NAD(P)/FAD-dependent oxidoreductase [Bacteroidia bacterium]|nr:NAD(P)/FAD-dependent oxidoreductase [Bacteroidia bacterium]